MPETTLVNPLTVVSKGGLILDTSVLEMPPGAASVLENWEPDIEGGYRTVDGFSKYSDTEVTGSGPILGVAILGSRVIACRSSNIMWGTGTSWSSINAARTNANKYVFDKYNWAGTEILIGADGDNYAFTYDNSTFTLLNGGIGAGAGTAPTAPTHVIEHKGHIFYGGYSNLGGSGAITFSAPYLPNDFTTAQNAGEIQLGDTFVTFKTFREELFIFCSNSIHRLVGSSRGDFRLIPVTEQIGCLASGSVQEVGGDLIFLGPDGLRTVAGTAKIGDVELASISKAVQSRLNNITLTDINSVVIREKTQYRMWFPVSATAENSSKGIIAVLKRNFGPEGVMAVNWEYADLKGIKPNICYSDYIGDDEYVLHGDFDGGFIYRQESGNSFDGANIFATYRTPHMIFGDPGIRKILERININYATTGVTDFTVRAIFDYEDPDTSQPQALTITGGVAASSYGTAVYGVGSYGATSSPILRQTYFGSGFAIAFEFKRISTDPSVAIRGFEVEIIPGGRR